MSQLGAATEPAPPGAPAWQLEFARVIAFPGEPALGLKQTWWQVVASAQPDDYTLTQTKGSHEERGTFQDVGLSLTIEHHRIEWLVEPLGTPAEADGRLPTIGPFRERIPWFASLMAPWLADLAPPVLRLAFVCKLLQPADTQEEVYRVLQRLLPRVNLTPRPNDFLFHVNRRRNSRAVGGVEINRMSTWSKLNVLLSVEPGKPFTWPEKGYSAVQVDINTAPEKGELLPAKALPGLFAELVGLGLEIGERGDVE
jgi:hypothetical protein